MKHWGQTLAIYVYYHCNIWNIAIYFCNIHVKQLKYASNTSETFQMYTSIISRCGLLRRLHRDAVAVARGEAGGLPRQGPALLLALAAPIGIVGGSERRSRSNNKSSWTSTQRTADA